jgi:hypothetical protein
VLKDKTDNEGIISSITRNGQFQLEVGTNSGVDAFFIRVRSELEWNFGIDG